MVLRLLEDVLLTAPPQRRAPEPDPVPQRFVWIEQVIASNLESLFPGLKIVESISMPGKGVGSEPVAMTICLALTVSPAPPGCRISTWPLPSKRPVPLR